MVVVVVVVVVVVSAVLRSAVSTQSSVQYFLVHPRASLSLMRQSCRLVSAL